MAQVNLLNNSGFERIDDDWNILSSASITTETSAEGNRSLRCMHVGDGRVWHAAQSRMVVPGKTYTLKLHLTHNAAKNVRAYIIINIRNTTGSTLLKTINIADFANNPTDGYKTYQFSVDNYTEPYVNFTLYLYSNKVVGTADGAIWYDCVQLMGDDGWFLSGDRGSGNNLLMNGDFETDGGWAYSGSAGKVNHNSYAGSSCLRLPALSGTQYAHVYQNVRIVRGGTYTLSFFAKRFGRKDIWPILSYWNAQAQKRGLGAAMRPSTSETYTLQTYQFTVPIDSISEGIVIEIYGGMKTVGGGPQGEAYIDDVQLRGPMPTPPQPQALYGIVANVPSDQTVTVRHAANTSSGYLGHWKNGAKFAILGAQGDGVRIRWGKDWDANTHAPTEDAWINSDFVETINMPTLFVDRYVEMALSFVGHPGSAWGYNDNNSWCQSFINNMAISAGLQNVESKILINSNTWDCYTWLMQNGQYTSEDLANCELRKGDWIYYRYNTSDNTSHVGIITDVDGRLIKTVAGNVITSSSQPHIVDTQDWFNISDTAYKVRGIARPNW